VEAAANERRTDVVELLEHSRIDAC